VSTQQPTWNGSEERRQPIRDLIRAKIPGSRQGHVFEDLDLICRTFLYGWPRERYQKLLAEMAGDVLTDTDIERIGRRRDRLDEYGVWCAVEMKSCADSCDHAGRRAIPRDTHLQYSKFMTFNQCLRLDAPNCAGLFLVHMEHEDPFASEWIHINGVPATIRQLVLVLVCYPSLAEIPTYNMQGDQL
jgi:hypothetical protein